MASNQSMEIITEALELANKSGVYNLKDSALIFSALNELSQKLSLQEELVQSPELVTPETIE